MLNFLQCTRCTGWHKNSLRTSFLTNCLIVAVTMCYILNSFFFKVTGCLMWILPYKIPSASYQSQRWWMFYFTMKGGFLLWAVLKLKRPFCWRNISVLSSWKISLAPYKTFTRHLNKDTSKEKKKIHTLFINECKLLLAFEAELWIIFEALLHVFWVVTTSNTQKCIRKIKKYFVIINFFAAYPNEVSGMEKNQQHCSGTVLFQALAT